MPQTVQELVVKYKSDISELQGKIATIESTLRKVDVAAQASGQNIKKGLDEGKNAINPFSSALEGLAGKLIAAFAVERIIAFGAECVKAFQEAEKNAKLLQTAVTSNGGLQSDFENLISQSEKLQQTTIFSDDEIQKAQTFALQFGLTATEVENLLPLITDYASATGKDLNSALEAVIQGINGQGRELKKSGIIVDTEATRTERFADIQEKLNAKFKDQAEVVAATSSGALKQYENQLDDIQEEIGEKLAPKMQFLKTLFLSVAEGANDFIDSLGDVFTGKIFEADSFEAKFKRTFDLAKSGFADLPVEELKKNLEDLTKVQAKATGDARTSALAQISALQAILKEKDSGVKLDLVAFNIGTATLKQLEERKKILATTPGLSAQDESERIDKEIEKRKKAADEQLKIQKDNSQKLLELKLKSTDDLRKAEAGDDPIKKLDAEYDAQIINAVNVFNLSRKSAEDRANLKETLANIEISFEKQVGDATIKIQEETSKKLKELNEKNAQEDLRDTLSSIDLSTQTRLTTLADRFKKEADFSKNAIEQNEKEKRAIEIEGEITKDNEIIKSTSSTSEQILKAKTDLLAKTRELQELDVKGTIQTEEQKRAAQLQTLDFISQISSDLFALADSQTNARIEALQAQQDEQSKIFDKEQEELEGRHSRTEISERQFEERSKKIKEGRVANEKKVADQIAEIKRKQAISERESAVVEIVINTAKAIVGSQSKAPILGIPYIAFYTALGALELATVLATPIPKFEHGKEKGIKAGLSLVGEKGPELMFVPDSAQILSNPKTKEFSKAIDAMYDNNWEKYVHQNYIVPALLKQKAAFESSQQESFAQNIANSFLLNAEGLDEYGLRRVIDKTNPRLAEAIGRSVAKNLQKDNRSHFRK